MDCVGQMSRAGVCPSFRGGTNGDRLPFKRLDLDFDLTTGDFWGSISKMGIKIPPQGNIRRTEGKNKQIF